MLSSTVSKILASALFALPLVAQNIPEGPQQVQVLVRADGNPPILGKDDFQLKIRGAAVPVESIQPVMKTNAPVELVIALDDGLRGNFASSMDEIRGLVRGLPPNFKVLVGFMQNGRVVLPREGGFNIDREETIRSLRIPLGEMGLSASPYFCIEDLAKHWPSRTPAARMMLVISNGIDPYNGRPTPMNQDSPYVDTAISAAQRSNVAVYTIFWSSFGVGRGFGSFSGESYLSQISEGTGGQLLSTGTMNAPTIEPYVKRFLKNLQDTYIVSFEAPIRRDLMDIKFSTKAPKTKLRSTMQIGTRP